MPLQIGIIAPPWLPVPSPQQHGEAEFVIDQLARTLTDAGYRVVLFTTGDSACPVDRRVCFPAALGTGVTDRRAELLHVEHAYRELAEMDVIHDHTVAGLQRAGWNTVQVPVVATIHGRLTPELRRLYSETVGHAAVVASSWAQRRMAPEVPMTSVIHYGVDTAGIPIGRGDGGYVMYWGRMHPDQGAQRAIEVARKAGRRIVLAGKISDLAERRYFATYVEPMLGTDAMYLGEISGERKYALLGGAEALIHPATWSEPSELPMIEALACGTPVVALREGVAMEVVDSGRTGFLCYTDEDLARKLDRVGEINRALCRSSVEVRFSAERMVTSYLSLYRRLTGVTATPRRRRRASRAPQVIHVNGMHRALYPAAVPLQYRRSATG